jgi:large subunit ribosomal protein L24
VEGVNIVKKHARPTQDNPQGGIIEKESSIHISNIMLVVGGKPTRVGFKSLENGKKVKFAKSTGEVIN